MIWHRIEDNMWGAIKHTESIEATPEQIRNKCEEELDEYIGLQLSDCPAQYKADNIEYLNRFCAVRGDDEACIVILSEEDLFMYVSDRLMKKLGFTEADLKDDERVSELEADLQVMYL